MKLNEPKKQTNPLIPISLLLTALMLTLNLVEYIQVSRAIRQYSCEVTGLQGQVDGLQFLRKLSEAQPNPTARYMVAQVAKAYEEQMTYGQLSTKSCEDVELTYIETQFYRLKRALFSNPETE